MSFTNSLKITLRNDLKGKNVKVKEGNAGIFRLLTTLGPGKLYNLRHDPNATYREYILIMLPDKTELRVLSSDDFNDWKEISIYENGGTYDWMGTVPRRSALRDAHLVNPPAATESQSQTPNGRGKFATLLQRFGIKL